MLTMLVFGGLLYKDVHSCEECLWFGVGVENEGNAKMASNLWQNGSAAGDVAEVSASAYSGTVKKALGINSMQIPKESEIMDNCGVWVFHPKEWGSLPGEQVEFDVAIGETPVAVGGGVAATNAGGIRATPLSDASDTTASCRVSLGADGKLRNWKDGNSLIVDGNCNQVSYVDDKVESKVSTNYNNWDMESSVRNRFIYGIVGFFVFIGMRLTQYAALFQALGSDNKPPESSDGCIGTCMTGINGILFILFSVFDWSFYSQLPAMVLEPLTGLNFLGGCSAVMAFRFSPVIWMFATAFGCVGTVFHIVDIGFVACLGKKNIIWMFIMFVVGLVLTAFVAAVKVVMILRYGFSMIMNIKVEWAFKFEFWPLNVAVNLDMFQLFCFIFFTYDLFFSALAGYFKYFASEHAKKKQAGDVGKAIGANNGANNAKKVIRDCGFADEVRVMKKGGSDMV